MSHVDRCAGAVRLSLGSGAEGLAEHGHRTHRNKSPPFLQLRKRRPGPPRTVQGRSARRGNTISDQSVRLRLKINHFSRTSRTDSPFPHLTERPRFTKWVPGSELPQLKKRCRSVSMGLGVMLRPLSGTASQTQPDGPARPIRFSGLATLIWTVP